MVLSSVCRVLPPGHADDLEVSVQGHTPKHTLMVLSSESRVLHKNMGMVLSSVSCILPRGHADVLEFIVQGPPSMAHR